MIFLQPEESKPQTHSTSGNMMLPPRIVGGDSFANDDNETASLDASSDQELAHVSNINGLQPPVAVETSETPTIQAQRRPTPVRMDLVGEIIRLTDDHRSIGAWILFVRSAPIATVYYAISSLKAAMSEGIVGHRGKYLIGIIRRQCPKLFQGKKQALSQDLQGNDAPIYGKVPESGPPVERDPELNMSQLKQIRAMLERRSRPIS